MEQKRKALSELEAQRQQRDEEMKREAIETRNKIIQKARCQKFEERDAVKAFNRALQNSEVLTCKLVLPLLLLNYCYHSKQNN